LSTTLALEQLCCPLDIFTVADLEGPTGVDILTGADLEGPADVDIPFLLAHDFLLCPTPLQFLHLITMPTLDILLGLGFSVDSLFLSFLGLPGNLTYGGARGFSLSEMGQLCIPSTGCR